ncbi:MAG: bifunctional phosphopantothenoylcysteine decarboxylase/phosphopantothenate--cysteine ligase CoaBC [Dehalococcoidia bacterium]|nr:bifunctional phosphopantothenoylcysteine decarboxylase/phosphopantothenate--cysteine ligase CoaBC [Dehalococcoidia bacterium]
MLREKTVVLGITGSIAAYKAAELASYLTQAGAKVETVMTEAAQRFISPLTLQSLNHRSVACDMWTPPENFDITHVSLAQIADVVLIAPATANIIAKLAHGLADDLLSSVVLATQAPVIVAPAMNSIMYLNQATQENLALLKKRGYTIVEPEVGRLACNEQGQGRLAALDTIVSAIDRVTGCVEDMAGLKVVVTAGGTREAFDPVRFIGNRSSGKMGYALAESAMQRGAEVTLITTTELKALSGVQVRYVENAEQMLEEVKKATEDAAVLVMAAAVADYRPKKVAQSKIKKTKDTLLLELERTPDILSEIKGKLLRIGFAAETDDLVHNAKRKLSGKKLDLIVANDVSAQGSGFGADSNKVILITRDGKEIELPLMSKYEVSNKIWDWVINIK